MKLTDYIKDIFNKEESTITSEVNNPHQWAYHYNPQKSKYHDYNESYFIQNSSGKILRLTADDIFAIIVFQDLGILK